MASNKWIIEFEAATCVGHGRCYDLVGELFEEDDEGHCVVRRREVDEAGAKRARVAVANCPEDALALREVE